MLKKMQDGKVFPVSQTGYAKEFRALKTKLQKRGSLDEVTEYLKDEIAKEDSFSCGTKFPMTNKKAWEGVLSRVFDASGRDVLVAGYFLGLLVMEIIIESDEQWLGCTTNINKRAFETMYYWRER
jgi:hypothetical protein